MSYYIFMKSHIFNPKNLIIEEQDRPYLSCYDVGFFDTKEEAEKAKAEMIKNQLEEFYRKGGETPYWKEFHSPQKKEEFKISKYPEPEFFAEFGYKGFDPYPGVSCSKYWNIKKA